MQSLNPYLKPLLNEINVHLGCTPKTNEHQIIKHLQDTKTPPFDSFSLNLAKDLFSAHFLCMHALYHLKKRYNQEAKYKLLIQSVRVERIVLSKSIPPINRDSAKTFLETQDPLESYYLNPKHYYETQEQEISDMLKSFWTKYLAQDKKQAALKTLNLPPQADAKMIKEQYRRLAQKHHPDKGGCAKMFNQVREAKSVLDSAI